MSETWRRIAAPMDESHAPPPYPPMVERLRAFAHSKGYTVEESLPDLDADVVLSSLATGALFVGDARFWPYESEKYSYGAACARILRLFNAFAERVRSGERLGGVLAMGCDCGEVAEAWMDHLQLLAVTAGLSSTTDPWPRFGITDIGGGYWACWW